MRTSHCSVSTYYCGLRPSSTEKGTHLCRNNMSFRGNCGTSVHMKAGNQRALAFVHIYNLCFIILEKMLFPFPSCPKAALASLVCLGDLNPAHVFCVFPVCKYMPVSKNNVATFSFVSYLSDSKSHSET